MTQQIIDVGTVANDGTGDSLRTAFIKSNDNFTELYNSSNTIPAIFNGNSNVSVNLNSNVTVGVAGVSNVMVVSSNLVAITGNLTVAGNASVTGNIVGANLNSTGNVVTVGIVGTGAFSTTGDIQTGGTFIGNGSGITGITVSAGTSILNGTANVQTILNGNVTTGVGGIIVTTAANTGLYVTGVISSSGNVTSNYFIGNGALLTGLIASVANISNGTSNVAVVSSSGNVTVGIGGTSNVAVFSTDTVTIKGNVLPDANITYNLGTSTQRWNDLWLSGSTIYLGNALISANATAVTITNPAGGTTVLQGATPSITGNVVSVSGNVIGGNILTGGLISATGNITGSQFSGSGAGLTSIPGANVSGTVANATYATSAGTATFAGTANAVAGANVSGTVANATYATSAGSATTATVANSANAVAGANVSGAVAFATTANAVAGANVSGAVAFATTANAVAGANVSGTVANATYATSAGSATTAGTATFAGTANAVAGANVSGTVANATYATSAGSATTAGTATTAGSATTAGTVTTAAQSNITSVGTLTSLTVSGTTNLGSVSSITITGGTAGYVLSTNGSGTLSWAAGGGGGETPNVISITSATSAYATANGSFSTNRLTGKYNALSVGSPFYWNYTNVNSACTLPTLTDSTNLGALSKTLTGSPNVEMALYSTWGSAEPGIGFTAGRQQDISLGTVGLAPSANAYITTGMIVGYPSVGPRIAIQLANILHTGDEDPVANSAANLINYIASDHSMIGNVVMGSNGSVVYLPSKSGTDPVSERAGAMYYNTTYATIRVRLAGGVWANVVTSV